MDIWGLLLFIKEIIYLYYFIIKYILINKAVEKMKVCPNCGANIEGLLYRCDCCGAMLSNSNSVFVQYTHTMAETGDLGSYMSNILDIINSSRIYEFFPLDIIAFDIYCYPENMVMKFNIRNKNYVSLRKKKAILTRIICYEEFVTMRRSQKKLFYPNL